VRSDEFGCVCRADGKRRHGAKDFAMTRESKAACKKIATIHERFPLRSRPAEIIYWIVRFGMTTASKYTGASIERVKHVCGCRIGFE
jgi:hypothetical protein